MMKVWLCIVISVFSPLVLAGTSLSVRGAWEQGGILFGHVEPRSVVTINGEPLQVTPFGDFVFGLNRDQQGVVTLNVTDNNGDSQPYQFKIQKREYNIQRIEGVKKQHVTPSKEFSERIAKESKLVAKARTLNDLREDFLQPFTWPLIGPITGVYGSQRVYNGVPKSPHYGIDIAAPTGTIVRAPASGVVTLAEPDLFYSGGTLIVDHGFGLSSTFIHLSEVLVDVGDTITQGQDIAKVGATGRATGPHLDWRMNWFKVRVDPGLLMKDIPMPKAK